VSEIGKHNNPKFQLQQWLKNPHALDSQNMSAIDQWLIEFPWFGSLHTLKAVYAKDHGLSDYPHHLHRAAITTHDRGWLYELMNAAPDASIEVNPNPATIAVSSLSVDAPVNNEMKDWVDIFLDDPDAVNTSLPEEEWENWSISLDKENPQDQPAEKDESMNSVTEVMDNPPAVFEVNLDSTEEKTLEDYPESVEFAELGELGQDIINKAISSSIELEVSEKETPIEEVKTEQKTVLPVDYEDSFLNFIAASIGEPVTENPTAVSPEKTLTEEKKKDDVIERFIQTEPQINRGKAIEYVAGNMAKESLEEDLNLVTETMAKLYVRQGKLDKARKAYKKLIELYPEKSIYFATQLKNLNKKN
jgi:tetratricopeptide (TPR) repeat protein